jgi:hypothetical protein
MLQRKVVEKIKTHVLCSLRFFENRGVCEIVWKNIVQWGRPQMEIRRILIACWIPKATNAHSEYIILIVFHCNNGLRKRLNFPLYIHFLSCFNVATGRYRTVNLFIPRPLPSI